jgi:hypothetical protein
MGGVETMNKKDLMKYLSAFVMGDGGVYYSGKHCRFVCNQVAKHEDYIKWRAGILENVTSVNVYENQQPDKQLILCTMTKAHPIFTDIRERLYIDNYKSVDPHYLKLLDWEMLAILFQDDGSLNVDNRCEATPTARLNTKRLSYGDSWLLKKALKDRLDLEWNVHRHYHRYFLSLRAKDSDKFFSGVKEFIKPSFSYKLPCSYVLPHKDVGDDIVRTQQ